MDVIGLKEQWKKEEEAAHIHGWDFSHITGRLVEQELPWDFEAVIQAYLNPRHRLLDVDTGAGEFLLRLHHPCKNTSVTEGYPPNATLCRETLGPLGIDVRQVKSTDRLPFEDNSFDMVMNRHGGLNAEEVYRVLKPNGLFLTQQVGVQNDRALVKLLLPGVQPPFPSQSLQKISAKLISAGFQLLRAEEAFPKITVYDVGALVWFAHVIPWEFPGFSVETCFSRLCEVQRMINQTGSMEGFAHRLLFAAGKPGASQPRSNVALALT